MGGDGDLHASRLPHAVACSFRITRVLEVCYLCVCWCSMAVRPNGYCSWMLLLLSVGASMA
jgi:hypothetical protein